MPARAHLSPCRPKKEAMVVLLLVRGFVGFLGVGAPPRPQGRHPGGGQRVTVANWSAIAWYPASDGWLSAPLVTQVRV